MVPLAIVVLVTVFLRGLMYFRYAGTWLTQLGTVWGKLHKS